MWLSSDTYLHFILLLIGSANLAINFICLCILLWGSRNFALNMITLCSGCATLTMSRKLLYGKLKNWRKKDTNVNNAIIESKIRCWNNMPNYTIELFKFIENMNICPCVAVRFTFFLNVSFRSRLTDQWIQPWLSPPLILILIYQFI